MALPQPLPKVTLSGHGVTLEPLSAVHRHDLDEAASDGELWNIRVTSVPAPGFTAKYIQDADAGHAMGTMLPFAVRESHSNSIVGSTRFHDAVAAIDRVEIGYTWIAKSWQRSHVNSACKLLLLTHAFETLGCEVVGWRTDTFNFASQRAIERLGAKRDGVIRHHGIRRDGTVRDTVMYSLLRGEWPQTRDHLQYQLTRVRESRSPC